MQMILLWLKALVRKRKMDTDMHEEMRSHIEMQTQENIDTGMSPEEARCAALRQFGWVESIKEECREQRGMVWLETFAQDVRFGLRMLRKSPGYTAMAVLTLALGIGANAAIFSVINAVLLRPLPFPKADRLVMVSERSPQRAEQPITLGNFSDWQAQNRAFDQMAAFYSANFNWTGSEGTTRLAGGYVTSGFFPILGLVPVLGRTPTAAEDDIS